MSRLDDVRKLTNYENKFIKSLLKKKVLPKLDDDAYYVFNLRGHLCIDDNRGRTVELCDTLECIINKETVCRIFDYQDFLEIDCTGKECVLVYG